MAGFCLTFREESDIKIREPILDYVMDFLGDATDFSWSSVKASRAVLLCCIEQGNIKSCLLKPLHVFIITKVFTKAASRQKWYYTNMFMLLVGLRMVNHMLIHKQNVVTNTKKWS